MPTWGELLRELETLKSLGANNATGSDWSPHDQLRRKYLKQLSDHTGRAAIIYATAFLETKGRAAGPEGLSLTLGDIQGFMEAVSNIKEQRELDLVLTSPGGSPEATEAIMSYLRTRFDNIRAIVPVAAMSAATMMALACDELVMGSHSQLGPIDPQFTVATPEGPRAAAGQAIIDQFEMAKVQIAQDPKSVGAWMPMLRSLLPGLLAHCEHSRDQAEHFVASQLERFMLAGDRTKSEQVAKWFADFSNFKSHGRPVFRDQVEQLGLRVTRLEDDQTLQELVLSVHHATRHTFNDTPTSKLIENHHGRAYLELTRAAVLQIGGPAGGPPQLNRQQRRAKNR